MLNGVAVSNNELATKEQLAAAKNIETQSEKRANLLKLDIAGDGQTTPMFDKLAKVESKSNQDQKPFRKNTLDFDHVPQKEKAGEADLKKKYKKRLENFFTQKSLTVKRKDALGIKSANVSPLIAPQ